MLSFADAVRNMETMSLLLGERGDGKLAQASLEQTAHLFVSGVTGCGKSVFLNSLLMALVLRNKPEYLKFALFDSKIVELSRYAEGPHLLVPVITSAKKLESLLEWIECEIARRTNSILRENRRSISEFNSFCKCAGRHNLILPHILIVIDDLSVAVQERPEIVNQIMNVLLKGRTFGIHLLLVSQNVSSKTMQRISEFIPSKVAFLTSTKKESRLLIGNSSAHSLDLPGSAIYSAFQGNAFKIKTIMISDDESDMILRTSKRMLGKATYAV